MKSIENELKEIQGTPVEETKDVLSNTTNQEFQKAEQTELLEGLEGNFTIEELQEDFAQWLKSNILSLVKQLPKSQQELFANLAVICVETKRDDHKLSDFYWLDIAIQQLGKDATKRIILTGTMFSEIGKATLIKRKPNETSFLFNNPRVGTIDLLQLHKRPETFVKLVINKYSQEQNIDRLASEKGFLKLIEQKIGILFHDLSRRVTIPQSAKNDGKIGELKAFFQLTEKSERQIVLEDEMIKLLQLQHPEYSSLSKEEKLEKIVVLFELAAAIVLPEGTRFEGVFVDWDGTLYDTTKKEIKEETLKMITDFQAEGKEVTIRTLWDVQKVQECLQQAGISLPVKSKTDFKGGIVEIAIDDLSEEDLFNVIKVKSEKHIQV